MPLENELEALLFYRAEPTSVADLARYLEREAQEIEVGLTELASILASRGVRLLRLDGMVELVTAPEAAPLVERLRAHELTRDLGKAGAETLAIVLYKGEATRADIDHVRGVQSAFIIRNLLIRGLIERTESARATRAPVYRPTTSLLAHLGVTLLTELPEYSAVRAQLSEFGVVQSLPPEETSVPVPQ